MRALPSIVAALVALGLTPAILRFLSQSGWERPNYRGRAVPFPAGIAVVAAATVALAVVAPLDELADADSLAPELRAVMVYVLGVAVLGLIDDVFSSASRGWRGHGAAVLGGAFSTGALKAVGSLGLALYTLSGQGFSDGRYLLGVAVLLLATNLLNLLDLRPGRSAKTLALLGAGLTLGAWDAHPAAVLGVFLAPLAVLAFYDLRERAMLGDTGSNLAGALAGLWLVLTLSDTGLAIALAVLAAVTLYGELRSISEFVDRVPPLQSLDSLGRPPDA